MLQIGSVRNPLTGSPERGEGMHGLGSQGYTVPEPSQIPEEWTLAPTLLHAGKRGAHSRCGETPIGCSQHSPSVTGVALLVSQQGFRPPQGARSRGGSRGGSRLGSDSGQEHVSSRQGRKSSHWSQTTCHLGQVKPLTPFLIWAETTVETVATGVLGSTEPSAWSASHWLSVTQRMGTKDGGAALKEVEGALCMAAWDRPRGPWAKEGPTCGQPLLTSLPASARALWGQFRSGGGDRGVSGARGPGRPSGRHQPKALPCPQRPSPMEPGCGPCRSQSLLCREALAAPGKSVWIWETS